MKEGGRFFKKDHSRLRWEILPAFTRLTGCVEASYICGPPAGAYTPTTRCLLFGAAMNTLGIGVDSVSEYQLRYSLPHRIPTLMERMACWSQLLLATPFHTRA